MAKKNVNYIPMHVIYIGDYHSCVQTFIAKETERQWEDITHHLCTPSLHSWYKDMILGDRYNLYNYGILKKENAYKIIHNKYWIMMYGPDFDKLVQTWNSRFYLGEYPRIKGEAWLNEAIDKLNKGEITV